MSDSLTIHHTREPHPDTSVPDPHQDTYSKTIMGFWMYLMTDCLIFGTLFATYAVLHDNTFGGPSSKDLYSLPFAFIETMLLLCSSLTCGMATLSSLKRDKNKILAWLGITFLLGIGFISMELTEFSHLVEEGYSWKRSAFLSAFFALVGTHGTHIAVGLLWMAVMAAQVYFQGVNVDTFRRLIAFNMFWHFLDLIWIFIFTFVYLLGVI